MDFEKQNRLTMQFHITGRCNLRCKHCYRTEGDCEPLSYDDVIRVIDQYRALRKTYNSIYDLKRKGHINITGGEPFIRADIKNIIEYMGKCSDEFSFGILSNGSFIDDSMIKALKDVKVSFVQLSIDGDRDTHDSLRAKGDYERVFGVASYLETAGIHTYISFTANKTNMMHLPTVGKECRKAGITKLWSDRLVPIGNGAELNELKITDREMKKYVSYLKKAKGGILSQKKNATTLVSMNRALQFLYSDGCLYSCSAGDSLITVDEFGNVMPCRRMPIICGDVFTSTLEEIYLTSETFQRLRLKLTPKECSDCKYSYFCRGGAKCQSYAEYGSFYRADPACPLRSKSI